MPAKASAQSTSSTGSSKFVDRLVLELGVTAGTSYKDLRPLELNVNAGYRFIPRMFAFIHAGTEYGLYNGDNKVKTYTHSQLLGGGLGYTFYKEKYLNIDVRCMVSSSIGNADWKQTVYDAGVTFNIRGFVVGLGYRHINSRSSMIKDYNGMYGTIGIGL